MGLYTSFAKGLKKVKLPQLKVKTSPKLSNTASSSASKIIDGGVKGVPSKSMKVAKSTALIGGTAAGVGLVGLKVIDYGKNVFAKNDALRQQEMGLNNLKEYVDLAGTYGNGNVGNLPSGFPSYSEAVGAGQESGSKGSGLLMLALLGVAVAGGAYVIGKKRKK